MSPSPKVVVVGAGIVGISTALWLRRGGAEVTVIDRGAPGTGTSHGNGGVLAACAMVPVTTPGLAAKAPKLLMNPEFPLFLRWSYLPKLLPWLTRYMRNANDADTRRIARGLGLIVGDSVEQHDALAANTPAEAWITKSDYSFAYADRAAFEADSYAWELRKEAGFVPKLTDGADVQALEPAFGDSVQCLATVSDHGFITDPGGYVRALAEVFKGMGGAVVEAEMRDVEIIDGGVSAVLTDQGRFECEHAVIATGVWSKPIMKKLGISVPLESERGYHIVFEGPSVQPSHAVMVAAGKFVATPMRAGLRCAGIVEFGGLDAAPSPAPFALMRRHVARTFPDLTATNEVEWMGHRPAPSDSLPLIGEAGPKGAWAAFGHHHIGLTGGPKTGRLLASMILKTPPNIDMGAYSPRRFG